MSPRKKKVVSENQSNTNEQLSSKIMPSEETDMLPLTLGMVLQQARHTKKVRLSTVSDVLRIKEIYLKALENGSYNDFPALAYGVGFLRSYAIYLGLNPEELIERFHKETHVPEGVQVSSVSYHSDPVSRPSPKTIVTALVLLFFVYLLWNFYKIMTYEPMPVLPRPIFTAEENTETVSDQEDTQIIEEENIVKKEEPSNRKITIYGLSKPARVTFVATDKVKIEVQDTEANNVLLSKLLEKGDQYNPVEDPEGLVLEVSNAAALDVFVDGKKVAPLGKKGQSRSGIQMDAQSLLKD